MNAQPTPPATGPKTGNSEFEAVTGLDPQTVREKRAFEEEVAQKVASDYAHIVWAYGIIWALFAGYGWLLWRKNAQLRRDLAALSQRLGPT